MTIDEVIEQFPVTREQIKAVLEFAARSLDVHPRPGADAILFYNGVPRGVASAEEPRCRGGPHPRLGHLTERRAYSGAAEADRLRDIS